MSGKSLNSEIEKDWGEWCFSREYLIMESYERNGRHEEGRGRALRRNKVSQELSPRVSGGREEDV